MFKSLRERLTGFVSDVGDTTEKKSIELSKATRIKGILKQKIKLSEKDLDGILWDLQMGLIQSNVAMDTSGKITEQLKERLIDRELNKGQIDEIIKNSMRDILSDILKTEDIDLLEHIRDSEKPVKLAFFGVNGVGKTLTIAKIGEYLLKNDFSIVLAAGDTFRAGAIEQLEKYGETLGVRVIKHQKGADSAAVIYDAIEHAKAKDIDVVLGDTSGRMHSNVNLMDEMRKICRVNKLDFKIFVGDSLTGNDAVEQAREFNDAIGIDAVILTKIDADTNGGSALSITNEIKKPILFAGTGQKLDDLIKFDKEWFVKKII